MSWRGAAGRALVFDMIVLTGEQLATATTQLQETARGAAEKFGVSVQNRGRGKLLDCDIFANAAAGVTINEGGNPVVRGCRVNRTCSRTISAGGQRIMFNYFTLDGVSNTDPNFNTYVVLPSIDALQEFKIQTSTYDASYGRNPGANVNVVTKSGALNHVEIRISASHIEILMTDASA